jgi:hypothetical protein
MPVEFALRPRIRLREDPAPARRARPRLPKFALPALAYWLVIGGLVFEFVRRHDANAPLPEAQAALAPLPPPPLPTVREWWRPLPAPATPQASAISAPPTPSLAPLETPLAASAPAEPAPAEPAPAEPAPEAPLASPARTRTQHAPATLRRIPTRTSDPANVPKPALALAPVPPPPAAPALVPSPPAAPASPPVIASFLPSCEAALASASQDVDFSGGNRTADLPAQAIAAVLENGAWLSSCAVPDHTTLDVCVAIKGGRVIGASVSSRPPDSALNGCVKRRASSLQFPYSPHVDLARTRF